MFVAGLLALVVVVGFGWVVVGGGCIGKGGFVVFPSASQKWAPFLISSMTSLTLPADISWARLLVYPPLHEGLLAYAPGRICPGPSCKQTLLGSLGGV